MGGSMYFWVHIFDHCTSYYYFFPFRERQSPKEMTKKTNSTVTITTSVASSGSEKLVKTTQSSGQTVAAATASKTASATAAKPASIESNFDLLSLSTAPTKTAIANDLLGLGKNFCIKL